MGRKRTQAPLTTTDVARLLNIAPSSVSRLMGDGLAGCIWEWGSGRGKQNLFSAIHVERWMHARRCVARHGYCDACTGLIVGFTIVGEHLASARHGLAVTCDGARGCTRTYGKGCRRDEL
ncbi:MAG: hypothetical protein R2712_31830 [Vicinamibacterales bacterium]